MIPLFRALSTVHAQDCDVRALTRELEEASPMSVPGAFHALYTCDPEAAGPLGPPSIARSLAGDEATPMLVDALSLGLEEEVRAWIGGLRSDERSSTLSALGAACSEEQVVADFLVSTEQVIGEKFWTQRWYRSLGDCHRPEVEELLRQEVQEPSGDRSRFLGVLEVFARNLGADAIPYLKTLLIMNEREEEATYIVNAFADAARVGSMNGRDEEAAGLAIAALFEMAPQLPERALRQAATTLEALGAGDRAGELAGAYYRDRYWEDGQLHHGLVVIEKATCKKGKVQVVLHQSQVVESGKAWLADLDVPGAVASWSYTLQADCKGTASETSERISEGPVRDAAGLADFYEAIRAEVAGSGPAKIVAVSETPVTF